MAIEIVMPKLGWTMEEGVLAEWLKQDGDQVEVGDLLFTVESDKALQEIEAFDSGILRISPDAPAPGSTIKIGVLLAYLVQAGESAPFELAGSVEIAAPAQNMASSTSKSVRSPAATQRLGHASNGKSAISPRARRIAIELGVDWTKLKGSGRSGRIVERDVRAMIESQPDPILIEITPVARRAAQELNVDLNVLAAQFPGKRITREHVEAVAAKATRSVLPPALPERTPTSHVRQVIADRMANSAHTTAPVTLTTEVDASELVRLRQQLKDSTQQIVPSYNDLLSKLVAHALQEHLMLNAQFDGDTIVQQSDVHIGLAVDTERGLLVPVLQAVQTKSIRQIAEETQELIKQAQAGKLGIEDLQGSTFTITNLGMYDIDAFTPIINLPECAILGVGRIVPKQIVVDSESERLAIRHMMFLSLTFDHRLVDGAPAARFLQRVKQFIEQPYLWLVE
jgi:pyruvate dehydrogenase E2 component (dihydrolipoyllysine-residue acetyltransferase)